MKLPILRLQSQVQVLMLLHIYSGDHNDGAGLLIRTSGQSCEPVWSSGKALGWYAELRTSVRYPFGALFSSERLWFVHTPVTLPSVTSY